MIAIYNSFNIHNSHDNYDKFTTPNQTGKGFILPKNFWLADANMVFHFQLCRYIICKELVQRIYIAAENQANGTFQQEKTCDYNPKSL